MLVMCAENVLRLAEIDCSSPMSAKSDLKTGSREPCVGGNVQARPAPSPRSRPAVLSATVLPPVFGPGDDEDARRRSQQDVDRDGIDRDPGSGFGRRLGSGSGSVLLEPFAHRRISSGCRAPRSSNVPSAAIDRLDAADHLREARARLDHVELGGDVDRALEVVGPRAEGVGQREQDAADLFGLLLFERDDVVVDLDGLERLEEQARAAGRGAVHDARDRARDARREPSARSGRCDR